MRNFSITTVIRIGLIVNKNQDIAAQKNRRDIDRKLDKFETSVEQLRVLYEQHFVEILPQPPDKLKKEVERQLRDLLTAPFKNSQAKFRMRSLITRYQTYKTYWERVNREKEEGRYSKDVFRSEMRANEAEKFKQEQSNSGQANKGMQQLYSSYEDAMKKTGSSANQMNFDVFKKSLIKNAQKMREQHGVKKLSYKIIMRNGKVIVKAVPKK